MLVNDLEFFLSASEGKNVNRQRLALTEQDRSNFGINIREKRSRREMTNECHKINIVRGSTSDTNIESES